MIKKYLPNKEQIKANKYLARILHKVGDKEYLWEFSQRNVAFATLSGVFWAMIPMPFQMVPAAIFAILLRANVIVAIAWVWLSNPITLVPILYTSYFLGCKILSIHAIVSLDTLNFSSIFTDWNLVVKPLLLGSVILGSASAITMATVVWFAFQIRKFIR